MAIHAVPPRFALLTRGLLPSAVLHVAALLGIALAAAAQPPMYGLIEVEIWPRPAMTQAAESVATSGASREGAALDEADRQGATPWVGAKAGPRASVPAAAAAGRVLIAPEAHGGPMDDLLDFSVVQGSAGRYAGGVTTSRGKSQTAVRDWRAREAGVVGVIGGTGTGAAPSTPKRPQPVLLPAPSTDASRPALPIAKSWQCPFPEEANRANVDFARVKIVVTVGIDGRAVSAAVLSDPGNGFAAAARSCALRQGYEVARDAHGRPRLSTTAPISVTFTR